MFYLYLKKQQDYFAAGEGIIAPVLGSTVAPFTLTETDAPLAVFNKGIMLGALVLAEIT